MISAAENLAEKGRAAMLETSSISLGSLAYHLGGGRSRIALLCDALCSVKWKAFNH